MGPKVLSWPLAKWRALMTTRLLIFVFLPPPIDVLNIEIQQMLIDNCIMKRIPFIHVENAMMMAARLVMSVIPGFTSNCQNYRKTKFHNRKLLPNGTSSYKPPRWQSVENGGKRLDNPTQ